MAQTKKRVQLRRCGICQKMGHNKSTCPRFVAPKKNTPIRTKTPAPSKTVNFFIHHVASAPDLSAHIIDLKPVANNSHTVTPLAPEDNFSIFHNYHNLPATSKVANVANAPAQIITDEMDLPVLQTNPIAPVSAHKKINFKDTSKSKHFASFKKSLNTTLTNLFHKISNPLFAIKNYWQKVGQNTHAIFNSGLFWKRSSYALGALIVILAFPGPVKSYYISLRLSANNVAESSTAGFMALQDSTASLLSADVPGAKLSMNRALNNFQQAVSTMESKHHFLQDLTGVIPVLGQEVKNRQNIILAGQQLALGNTYLLKGIGEVQAAASSTLTERVAIITAHLQAALPNYQSALNLLEPIDPGDMPLEYQSAFKEFKNVFGTIVADFGHLAELGNSIQEIFGGEGLRRYLIVFQNENEIRPTGGFIGSFALLDIKDGKIVGLDVPPGGSYDLQGQLDTYVEPPAPLLLANKRWEFQDGNWFPDFPASAEKLLWFYRHSRGITADGVIAVNSKVLEKLLGIVGPVTDTKRNITITSDNVLPTIQNIVETSPEKQLGKPKQIIADLAPKFINILTNSAPADIMPILTGLKESLVTKQIQAYFTDQRVEKIIKKYGWGGQILATNAGQDFLMVVNTNIQGQKSDANIKQSISHQAVIATDGTITDTVIITRAHNGSNTEDLYDATNIDYLRLYVPAGSKLISAQGFTWPDEKHFRAPDSWSEPDAWLNLSEKTVATDPTSGTKITDEFGKTAFGNWVITEPGDVSQAIFVYELPFKATDDTRLNTASLQSMLSDHSPTAAYQLVVQNQSGINSEFDSQIIAPDNWEPVWKDGPGTTVAANGLQIEPLLLNTDQIWSLVLKKK